MSSKLLFLFFFVFISLNVYAKQYCVKKDGTATYNSAKKTDIKNQTLKKNFPLIFTGKKENEFIEVIDSDDKVFWVNRSSVTQKNNCILLKSNSKLRNGPGKKFKIVKTSKKVQTPALEVTEEDGWILVEYEKNKTAWVEIENISRPKSKIRISFEKDN